MKPSNLLKRILTYVKKSEEILLLQYFLYEWDLKDLDILSHFFDLIVRDEVNNMSEEEIILFQELVYQILLFKNPLTYQLTSGQLDESLFKEIKSLITACSLAKLAKLNKIKFSNVHLPEDQWKVELT